MSNKPPRPGSSDGLEVVADFACHTGECPLWHADEKCVYWTDIPNAALFRYDPASGETGRYDTDAPVGGMTLHEDGRLLLFMAEGAIRLWRNGRTETVLDSIPEEKGNRFNDVIADPEGRVFCGVMSTEKRAGRLYRLDPNGRLTVVLEGTGTANGMGFTPDLKQMYFCDTRKNGIFVFDYDRNSGDLSNRRTFIETDGSDGRPDGMTVDTAGCVWSARWGGGCLVRHAADGSIVRRIEFPVKKVSSITFGGDDYTDMYVTTAGGSSRKDDGELAGALFRLNAGVRGRPEFRSRLRRV